MQPPHGDEKAENAELSQAPLPHFRDGAGRADQKNIQISGTLQNLVPNKPAAQFSTPQDKF